MKIMSEDSVVQGVEFMLYISRVVGIQFIGVVDTDDGVEEIVPIFKVREIVSGGIPIKGVEAKSPRGAIFAPILPYQVPETYSPLQSKLKFATGIDVLVYNDMVTSIRFDAKKLKAPVAIRLSSFAPKCADCILFGNSCAFRHVITLVLDDKVQVGVRTFRREEGIDGTNGVQGLGVKFDLREITKPDVIDDIRKSMLSNDGNQVLQSVIFPDWYKPT